MTKEKRRAKYLTPKKLAVALELSGTKTLNKLLEKHKLQVARGGHWKPSEDIIALKPQPFKMKGCSILWEVGYIQDVVVGKPVEFEPAVVKTMQVEVTEEISSKEKDVFGEMLKGIDIQNSTSMLKQLTEIAGVLDKVAQIGRIFGLTKRAALEEGVRLIEERMNISLHRFLDRMDEEETITRRVGRPSDASKFSQTNSFDFGSQASH